MFEREAFCELLEKVVDALERERVACDATKEILAVPVELEGRTLWIIHEISDDTLMVRIAIKEAADALQPEVLARMLQVNWALACMHMPLIALDAAANQVVYSVRQQIRETEPAELAVTVRHLLNLAERLDEEKHSTEMTEA